MSSPYRTIKVVFLLIDVIFSATIQAQERKQQPDTLAAWEAYQRADTLLRSGDFDSSIVHFRKAKEYYKKERIWRGYMDATNRIGRSFIEMAQYDSARYYLDHALLFAKEKNLSSDYWLGVGYANKALLLRELGDYKEAIRLGKKALKIWDEANKGKEDKQANVLSILGGAYQKLGKYELALEFYKEGLKARIRMHGENHEDVAASYFNIAGVYRILGKHDITMEYSQKALNILIKRLGEQHPNVATIYYGMGVVSGEKGDYNLAKEYLEKAVSISLERLGDMHPRVAIFYNSLGLVLYNKGDIDKAAGYFEKAVTIEEQAVRPKHMRLGTYLNSLGMVYYAQKDFDKAIEYYERAAQIWRDNFGEKHQALTISYRNLGHSYLYKGDHEKAIEYFERALTMGIELFGPGHHGLVNTYSGLGSVFQKMGDHLKAVNHYKRSLAIQLQTLGNKTYVVANIYHNMGVSFKEMGHFDKAIKMQNDALSTLFLSIGNKHSLVSLAYCELGNIHELRGDHNTALYHYQKALVALLPEFKEEDWRVNPDLDGRILSKPNLLYALEAKARALATYYQEVSCDVQDLQLAVETYFRAMSLIDDVQRDYTYEGSKLSLQERTRSVYEGAAMALELLYERTHDDTLLGQLFALSEHSKANILKQSLQGMRAQSFAKIPDSLVQQDVDLRRDIAYYDTEIGKHTSDKAGHDTTLVRKFESRLFELRRGHERLTELLETKYPKYHRIKYSQEVVSVGELQHLLDDRTAQIAFFQANSLLFTFTITSKGFQITHTPLPMDFEALADRYRRSLSDETYLSQFVKDSRREYLHTAHALYRLLLEEPLSQLPGGIERLVIVPDGPLVTLPFETLLTHPSEALIETQLRDPELFKDLPYLLRDHDISYASSATLWREQRGLIGTRETALKPFVGFAPTYEELTVEVMDTVSSPMVTQLLRTGNKDLPGALEEVQRVSDLLDGDHWLGEQATEARFKKVVQDYQVLHLSMHGLLDDGDPSLSKLLFSPSEDEGEDGFLHASEIYATPMVAEMAVLSACDTGYGTLHHGEGVMSLSRAFAYAGCPSVVGSLWKAQDRATSQLMVEFYGQLGAGLTKDAALRQAKLTYLDHAQGNELHPSHWAAFVVMGDNDPIDLRRSPQPLWWVAIGGLLIWPLVLLIRKVRRYSH